MIVFTKFLPIILFLLVFTGANDSTALNEDAIISQLTNESKEEISSNTNSSQKILSNVQESQKQGELSQKYPKENPIEGEVDLFVREFQSIHTLFCKLPTSRNSLVQRLRLLLTRIQNISPQTKFLKDQQLLLEAAIRYKLNLPQAEGKVLKVVQSSEFLPLRDKAARMYVSYLLEQNNWKEFEEFYTQYKNNLSPELAKFFEILQLNKEVMSDKDAMFLTDQMLLAPMSNYYSKSFFTKILSRTKHNLSADSLDVIIDMLLQNKNYNEIIGLMRIRLTKSPVSYLLLQHWGKSLGRHEDQMVRLLRDYPNEEDYDSYISYFYKRANAANRGRIYNVQLHRFRGDTKYPYNLSQTEHYFQEYIAGNIEERYLKINSEYAFRNFLAFKRYDKIVEYSEQIDEKIWEGYVPPHINFWHAYSLLKQGQTNDTVMERLGRVVIYNPESYYGLLSQNLLETLFKNGISKNKMFNLYKNKRDTVPGRLNYAMILYYLGSFVEKIQAKSMLQEISLIHDQSKIALSSFKEPTLQAYLKIGLKKEAKLLMYLDGIKNTYMQDLLLSHYIGDSKDSENMNKVISGKSFEVQNIFSFIVGNAALRVYYPRPYSEEVSSAIAKLQGQVIDPYLVYSVIRAESFYNPRAYSKAGARGLMQIMPTTGRWLADRLNVPDFSLNALYKTDINVYMGTFYLYENIGRMGLIPALAAYNSGPTYVNKIIKQYEPNSDLELVEIHPKTETRNYVRKIMEFYQRYKQIYENKDISLYSLIQK